MVSCSPDSVLLLRNKCLTVDGQKKMSFKAFLEVPFLKFLCQGIFRSFLPFVFLNIFFYIFYFYPFYFIYLPLSLYNIYPAGPLWLLGFILMSILSRQKRGSLSLYVSCPFPWTHFLLFALSHSYIFL